MERATDMAEYPAEANTILYNGKIVTVDDDFTIAQAVSIRDGRFQAVGRSEEIMAYAGPGTKTINLDGKTAIPGIIDSHNHMLLTGLEKQKVSLGGASCIADVLDIIRDACKAAEPGEWVITMRAGFVPSQLKENRVPNRWELDGVAPGNPVLLVKGVHFGVVNSYALKLANITKDTPQPAAGIIVKDPESGEPTGGLGDSALDPIKTLLPKVTHEDKVKALTSVMKDFNALGITSVIDTWLSLDDLKAYQELWANKEMTVRARIWLTLSAEEIGLGPATISRQAGLGASGDDMLRVDGLKQFLDGGIETGLLRDPYLIIPGEQEDSGYRGVLMIPKDEFSELCSVAAQSGWRLGVHCTGDSAIDIVLDTWEETNKKIPIVDKHWVILHGILARPEHFERINRLGVYVASQHIHTYSSGDRMVKWWGFERASSSDPIKEYMKEGVMVGGGSDAPSNEWHPSILFWFDLTRQSRGAGVLGPGLALTRRESLIYHTINAARISDDGDKQGSIEAGKLADLVVLSDDILTCPVDSVKGLQVEITMVGGNIVYHR
jgi:predicted amidohydrolase YtcJ